MDRVRPDQREELGITKANVDQMAQSDVPAVRRLLGTEGDFGKFMGMDNKWAFNAIKAVGNYGEVYDRHFGPATQINLPAQDQQPLEQRRHHVCPRRCGDLPAQPLDRAQ